MIDQENTVLPGEEQRLSKEEVEGAQEEGGARASDEEVKSEPKEEPANEPQPKEKPLPSHLKRQDLDRLKISRLEAKLAIVELSLINTRIELIESQKETLMIKKTLAEQKVEGTISIRKSWEAVAMAEYKMKPSDQLNDLTGEILRG